ncbi:MAG: hypothetical protein ABS81_25505 [Pseudonocardia sp. SCN 72-86]|nr:MAG: hypothetical protein ABS81_25505 [Pseudonocardia sp. SCN 72-86]
MLDLDHLIVFLSGPDAVPALDGFSLDAGMRHEGQGTRNRRLPFPSAYVEFLWVDEPEVAGLGFPQRCSGAGTGFGVVARGDLPAGDFTDYTVPGGGPALSLLTASLTDLSLPFVGVFVTDDPDALRPEHRAPAQALRHPCGARDLVAVQVSCPTPPSVTVHGVTFVEGPPGARLTLDGAPGLRL